MSDAARSPPLSPRSAPRLSLGDRWSCDRVARLGFLVGRGCGACEIAADAAVAATPAAVRRKAQRLGLELRPSTGARLPDAILWRLAAAAARRGVDRDTLIHRLLLNAGSDDALLDNILDDD